MKIQGAKKKRKPKKRTNVVCKRLHHYTAFKLKWLFSFRFFSSFANEREIAWKDEIKIKNKDFRNYEHWNCVRRRGRRSLRKHRIVWTGCYYLIVSREPTFFPRSSHVSHPFFLQFSLVCIFRPFFTTGSPFGNFFPSKFRKFRR